MQQTKKEILKRKVPFELGLISLLSVSVFFVLQTVNVEAYENGAHSVLADNVGSIPSVQKYILTVTNGTGSGSYAERMRIAINANATISEKVFDKWTGDIEYVADVNSATTTVTMPAKAITLTASYKTIPYAQKYALIVEKGRGSGLYIAGDKVTITANPAPRGKIFSKWMGATKYVTSAVSPTTTVTMPAKTIALVASYKTVLPKKTYALTVKNGTGSGSYAQNTKVTIAADNATVLTSKIFSRWTGDTKYVADANSATTTVTMPAKAITLTATYKDRSNLTQYQLTVKNGTGSGAYTAGTKVKVAANAAPEGKVFDKWTGDTEYIASRTLSGNKDVSIYQPTITVLVPAKAITLAATYKDRSNLTQYQLTVKNGTGTGSYAKDTKVTITANSVNSTPTGKAFDKWTGDTKYVQDVNSATTTLTMPNKAVTVVATYKTVSLTQSLKSIVTSKDTKVQKGAKNVILVEADLTNTGTETLTVSGLGIMADYGSNSINNVKLYIDDKDMESPAKTKVYEVIYKSLPLKIEAGKTAKLVLKGDISSNMKLKGLGFRLDSCTNVFTVKGATSGKKAKLDVSGKSYLYFTAK